MRERERGREREREGEGERERDSDRLRDRLTQRRTSGVHEMRQRHSLGEVRVKGESGVWLGKPSPLNLSLLPMSIT